MTDIIKCVYVQTIAPSTGVTVTMTSPNSSQSDFAGAALSTADATAMTWTIADVLARLPGIPASRIHAYPSPGLAAERDVLETESRTGRICELIDGVLVEKVMATNESILAAALIYFLHVYLDGNRIGTVAAPDGLLRILPGQVRAPDVSFVRWEKLPDPQVPKPRIYAVVPDLEVEILSEGNSAEEMERKLRDYFAAGVRLVWYIEPQSRTARAYLATGQCTEIGAEGSLCGGEVLPGFELPLAKLFDHIEPPKPV